MLLSTEELMLLNCGVGEDSWESLGLQGDPVHPKGNESWVFTGRTDVEAETPILWPPDAKSWLIGKDTGAGKDWGQEKGLTEDETVGWHHWLNGHEFEQALGAGDGQGSLACCSPWGLKASDTAEWLNRTDYGQLQLQDPLRTVGREFMFSCSLFSSETGRLFFCLYSATFVMICIRSA